MIPPKYLQIIHFPCLLAENRPLLRYSCHFEAFHAIQPSSQTALNKSSPPLLRPPRVSPIPAPAGELHARPKPRFFSSAVSCCSPLAPLVVPQSTHTLCVFFLRANKTNKQTTTNPQPLLQLIISLKRKPTHRFFHPATSRVCPSRSASTSSPPHIRPHPPVVHPLPETFGVNMNSRSNL